MKKSILVTVSAVALILQSAAAFAQDPEPAANGQKMKGPPNANGYQDKQGGAASEDKGMSKSSDKMESSDKMKGPPNANGASSDKQ